MKLFEIYYKENYEEKTWLIVNDTEPTIDEVNKFLADNQITVDTYNDEPDETPQIEVYEINRVDMLHGQQYATVTVEA